MAAPPIMPFLLHLAARPFSFYPAIAGVAHNEWLLRKATWQEWVVVNSRTREEISIPRRFVGDVSSTDHPVLIVGLLRELQCKNGIALPHEGRVIEMPRTNGENVARQPRAEGPAPVIGIRLETRRPNRLYQWVGAALALAIFLYVATANLIRTVGRRSASHPTRPFAGSARRGL